MRFWLTVATLLVLIGLAGRFGKGPERSVAGILATNLALSVLNVVIRGPLSFKNVDPVLLLIDSGTLFAVIYVALRANRMWPLLIAALQLFVWVAHLSALISIGWDQVYWGMMALSQYLQLIVLAAGIASHYVREKRKGPYRSWRSMRHA